MAPDPSKAVKGRIRELASIAYERELSNALVDVEAWFARWRGGEINSFEVSAAIHEFHQGVSQELFSKYQSIPEMLVARAIHDGIISKDEAGTDIVEQLAGWLASFDKQ